MKQKPCYKMQKRKSKFDFCFCCGRKLVCFEDIYCTECLVDFEKSWYFENFNERKLRK